MRYECISKFNVNNLKKIIRQHILTLPVNLKIMHKTTHIHVHTLRPQYMK